MKKQNFWISAAFLITTVGASLEAATIGYYQFEDSPGFTQDSSTAGRNLTAVSSPTQTTSPFGTVPNPPAGASSNLEAALFTGLNDGFTATDIAYADLTIEAYVNLSSVDTGGLARVIAAQFGGTTATRAFNFGIAGNSSGTFTADRTLFLQLSNGTTLFNLDSSYRLTLGNNYYLAASIDAGASGSNGSVTFYLKDLTAGTALQSNTVAVTGFNAFTDSSTLFSIGSAAGGASSFFDGTIDEVRFSNTALAQSDLLISPIPEPSTYALLAGGLVLLGFIRRRSKS